MPARHRRVVPILVATSVLAIGSGACARVEQAGRTVQAGGNKVYNVGNDSMAPSLRTNDKVAAVTAQPVAPQVGNIVVVRDPNRPGSSMVKRVIAHEGQVVTITNGRVRVDDVPIDEPYLAGDVRTEVAAAHRFPGAHECSLADPCPVPNGSVFVLGDNRSRSEDSRYFGPLPIDSIEAVVISIVDPPERIGPVPGVGGTTPPTPAS